MFLSAVKVAVCGRYALTERLDNIVVFSEGHQLDEVAEWLRRWTANPLCSARVGSNPILVDAQCFYCITTLGSK